MSNEQVKFLASRFEGLWQWVIQLHKELEEVKTENLILKMQLEVQNDK